ncbi:phytanoyl-CoA dioxygenase family protein [Agriterribacter sp.]|uniref:phytanoyl-CoA dioxygenase family protein n=1 Tax=Agriterribacter sp. TaxID=2821509 RepID=UPI002BA0227D|nr:phytanoyl-CoA dioxygenase family protein [Agriterribacter sp.]HRP54885.1 phytanoyl-CoA dioxygenase family protein [Agriterribacter sp.]
MIELIKRTKPVYAVYNFFHKRQLAHNIPLLKKLGLKKKYYSSLSSKDFTGLPEGISESITTDRQKLAACALFRNISDRARESLLSFDDKGFAIIDRYLSVQQADAVNAEIGRLLEQRKLKLNERNKIMFAIHASGLIWNTGNNEDLKEVLSALLGGKAILFQSINFLKGSEQATHSDSIHMTTFPLGGLLGVWIALEDITDENGPLHYYPGSHKLPYYLNSDYGNEGNALFLGNKSYADYEHMIAERIKAQKLEKVKFFAKKGDLIIWHANLFHGGDPHLDKEKTRKSMVFHYFKENVICYHEITQRPALIKQYR